MTGLVIAGGVYRERCVWPAWDQLYGSGGRAAAALSGHAGQVILRSYAQAETAAAFAAYARTYGFRFEPVESHQIISFDYIHTLSVPQIRPAPIRISRNPHFSVKADAVLRFGMMEGSAIVDATYCVYDPQSAFEPEAFEVNGSRCEHLAIVANRGEIVALGGHIEPLESAKALIARGAKVVVVKSGSDGAYVIEQSGVTRVPPYRTNRVWTIGSGDVFAAMFAAQWAVHKSLPVDAARLASAAVATYVETMSLPAASIEQLRSATRGEAQLVERRIYLAGPFFTLGQRWLIDESLRCLKELGLKVFSPVHDVGPGDAYTVAPADLAALNECDAVFAILDGNDTGTLFEVGYARAMQKPVYALAQAVSDEDLKMVSGSGCRVYDDFVTALHHVAWSE